MDSLFSGLDLPPRIVTPEPRAYQERINDTTVEQTRRQQQSQQQKVVPSDSHDDDASTQCVASSEGGFMLHTRDGPLRAWDAQQTIRDTTGRAATRGGRGRVALALGAAAVCLTTTTGTALVETLGETRQTHRNKMMHFNGGAPSCCVFCGDSTDTIVVGFGSGHVLLVQDTSRRHLNPKMVYAQSPVAAVALVPDSQHLIFVAFANGVVVLLDTRLQEVVLGDDSAPSMASGAQNAQERAAHALVIPSLATFTQSRATANPRAARKLAQFVKEVTDMAVTSSKLALCGRDGTVLVCSLDMAGGALSINERVSFKTYFGAALCLSWSSNGRLLAVGGEDDMVHIYDAWTEAVIYRCCGHSSFVTGVCFEESFVTKDDESVFSLLSVGEDCKLCLYEVKVKAANNSSHANNGSGSVDDSAEALQFKRLGSLPKAAVEIIEEPSAYAVLKRYLRRIQGVASANTANLESGKVENVIALWDMLNCIVFRETK